MQNEVRFGRSKEAEDPSTQFLCHNQRRRGDQTKCFDNSELRSPSEAERTTSGHDHGEVNVKGVKTFCGNYHNLWAVP